jgi:shikimate dehydrogenase
VRLFGLIGFPLSHSFSEQYFTEKFHREGIKDAMYRKFPITDLSLVNDLISCHPNLRGLNVTIPFKEQIIPLLNELDETAKAVGAVNTVVCQPSAELVKSEVEGLRLTNAPHQKAKFHLKGFNTDVHGFRQSLKPFLASHHERALILGTGGASKAVEYVLKNIGVECVFVSRSAFDYLSTGQAGAKSDNTQGRTVLKYSQLNQYVIEAHKLIVNCSPVGTFPDVNAAPEIPYEFVTENHFLYDLVYNPAETEFLKRGKAKGALTLNGMDMLKMQAEAAWSIWNQSR